jgi:hypothetical protein
VLTLDTGGSIAFLDEAGFVYYPDAVPMRMMPGDILLQSISQCCLIPPEQAEKLLQVSRWLIKSIGHWLDTFSGQLTQLPLDIEVEITAGRNPAEAVIELVQKSGQLRFYPHNRFGVHADNLLQEHSLQENYRLAA